MKFFTKKETIMILAIFITLFIMAYPNFLLSIKRSRDLTRKDSLGEVTKYVFQFQSKYKEFPKSTEDGRIVACLPEGIEVIDKDGDNKIDVELLPCEWGDKSFMGTLPQDPKHTEGTRYLYVSNGRRYQLFTALEAKDDDEYVEVIEKRNLSCGSKICNSGRAFSNTPLDKTLEEYEYELYEESLKK